MTTDHSGGSEGGTIVGIMRAYLAGRARAKAAREHTLASPARGRHNS
jgi:hypothetical protein